MDTETRTAETRNEHTRRLALDYQAARAAGNQPAADEAATGLLANLDRLLVDIAADASAAWTEWEDMFAEAQLAVVEAAGTWAGTPAFQTYAAGAARKRCAAWRAGEQRAATTRVPASWLVVARVARGARPKLEAQLGRPVSWTEVAEHIAPDMEAHAGGPDALLKRGHAGALARIEDVMVAVSFPDRLDRPVSGEEGESTLADRLRAPDTDPLAALVRAERRDAVRGLVAEVAATLDERGRVVLANRMAAEPLNFQELSKQLGVTPERTRQLDGQVLARFQHPSLLRRLRAA